MNLLFDLIATQPTSRSKFHGASEYAKKVLHELRGKKELINLSACYDKNKYIDPSVIGPFEKDGLKVFPIQDIGEIPSLIRKYSFDRFYSALPYGFYNLKFPDSCHFMFTIHGLREIEMPTDKYEINFALSNKEKLKYLYKKWFLNSFLRMKKKQFQKLFQVCSNFTIFTPSLHTKYSLICNFPEIATSKISLCYSPSKISTHSVINPNERFFQQHHIMENNYFLIISCDRWVKNCVRALQAFNQVTSSLQNTNIQMVVVGGNKKILSKCCPINDRIIFVDYVDSVTLETLYKNAFAFIYPSLNEGFGYPPLEAMKYGTPVLASAISSIPEVCGKYALYFNPFSVQEIACRIKQSLDVGFNDEWKRDEISHYQNVCFKQEKMLNQLITRLIT